MKNRPTMFLLDLPYKTVLWCFLFDFMLISNGTGHSFIVFLYIKEEINFFEYFWKTCKKPLFKQNFSLFKVNFGQLGLKFRTNPWAIFSRKKSPNAIKNCPNGEISPNLVTLDISSKFLDVTSANSYKNATVVWPINGIEFWKMCECSKKSLLGAT